MDKKPKIVIADSQFLITGALKNLISEEKRYDLCGIVDNRQSLFEILQQCSTDLLITDYFLVDYENLDDLKMLLERNPKLSILILTNQLIPSDIGSLIKTGIKNISLKTDNKDELSLAIDMAVRHKKYFSDQVLDLILELSETKNSSVEPSGLTLSEIEIVKLVANGYTTKEIAQKKNISFHTVMTHRKNIFRKLEINNVSELIRFAVRKGLIDYVEYNI